MKTFGLVLHSGLVVKHMVNCLCRDSYCQLNNTLEKPFSFNFQFCLSYFVSSDLCFPLLLMKIEINIVLFVVALKWKILIKCVIKQHKCCNSNLEN